VATTGSYRTKKNASSPGRRGEEPSPNFWRCKDPGLQWMWNGNQVIYQFSALQIFFQLYSFCICFILMFMFFGVHSLM